MCTSDPSGTGIYLDSEAARVLGVLASGLSGTEAADRLGLSPDAVRWHLRRAMRALGAHSRLEAVMRALELGLIQLPED